PVGRAVLLGGMTTTIGSGTNILAVGIAADFGVRFHMFDFFVPAAMGGAVGILFLWLVAPRLIPERRPMMADTSPRLFNGILHIHRHSAVCGSTLTEARARTDDRMRVDRIGRADGLFVARLPLVTLQAGDRLHVRDTADRLKEYERALGATLYDASDIEHPVSESTPLRSEGQQLAEVVVS